MSEKDGIWRFPYPCAAFSGYKDRGCTDRKGGGAIEETRPEKDRLLSGRGGVCLPDIKASAGLERLKK